MAEASALVQDLPPGTIFRKPKGDVLFMLTTNFTFEIVARKKLPWFPQPGGSFKSTPSIFPVPINIQSLYFAHKAWSLRNFWLRMLPAISLHKGRFEFFALDREVIVMGTSPSEMGFNRPASKGPQDIPLEEYVRREKPPERITRRWKHFLVIKYPVRYWTKGGAWDHLVANPPPELLRWPGISKDDNPYRAKHIYSVEYCWMARLPTSDFSKYVNVEVRSEVPTPAHRPPVRLLGTGSVDTSGFSLTVI